jgi:two-component sensor histidine kinase
MIHGWRIFVAASAGLIVALVFAVLWYDRASTLSGIERMTAMNARLVAAHGDAALGEARQILVSLHPDIERWDPSDPGELHAMHLQLQRLVRDSPRIRSAWIVDAKGVGLIDSWTFPSDPIDSSQRQYFQRHLAGEPNPVIMGSETGSVARFLRFTYSEAIRDETGEITSVVVVGLATSTLATIYEELFTATQSLAGLYKVRGDALAQSAPAADGNLGAVAVTLGEDVPASGVLRTQLDGDSIVAWSASREFPGVVALSASDMSGALADWQRRAVVFSLFALSLILLILALGRAFARVQSERDQVARLEFASQEVQHRMRNSLQMIASFVRLRARRAGNEETRQELGFVSDQIRALAGVQQLLEVGAVKGEVDLERVIEGLCKEIEGAHGVQVLRSFSGLGPVEAADAGSLAILVNELIMNGLKHGDGRVRVDATADGGRCVLAVASGAPLPEGFDLDGQKGFGLRAVRAIADSLSAELCAGNGDPYGGAVFRLSFPTDPDRDPRTKKGKPKQMYRLAHP